MASLVLQKPTFSDSHVTDITCSVRFYSVHFPRDDLLFRALVALAE
jgi:hypothetical protein